MNKRYFVIIITLLYFLVIAFIWFKPLKRLFIIDWKEGYYFSKQFDSQQDWVNTKNAKKIGLNTYSKDDCFQYDFKKQPDERIIVRILYGIPFLSQNKTQNFQKAVFMTDKFQNRLSKKAGYIIYRNNKQKGNIDSFSIRLEKEAGLLDIRRIEVSVLPPREAFLPNLPLFGLLLGAPFLIIAFLRDYKKSFIYLILTLIIFIGAAMRWQEIERVAFAPMHPDAYHAPTNFGYYPSAMEMKLFDKEKGFLASSRDYHEPGYPLIVKGIFALIGPSTLHLRFVSFLFAILALILTFFIGRQIIGYYPALLATTLIGINPFLIEQASYGVRTELEMVMLLVFFWLSFYSVKKMKLIVWCIITGLFSGFWLIIRSFNFILVTIISAISIFLQRPGWIRGTIVFIIFMALALSMLVPYKYGIFKKHGDPFWDTNRHVADHVSFEFGRRPDLSPQEINLRTYFFKLHTLAQFILYNSTGLLVVAFSYYQELFNLIHQTNNLIKSAIRYGIKTTSINFPFAVLFSLMALFVFIWAVIFGSLGQGMWQIWLAILLVILFNIFFYGAMVFKGGGILETHRTIAHALPLVALVFSRGLCNILSFK